MADTDHADWLTHDFTAGLAKSYAKREAAALTRLLEAAKASTDPRITALAATHERYAKFTALFTGKAGPE